MRNSHGKRALGPFVLSLLIVSMAISEAQEKRGPLGKLFGRKAPAESAEVVSQAAPAEQHSASLTTTDRDNIYPEVATRGYRKTRSEEDVDRRIDEIYAEYEDKVAKLTAGDLQLSAVGELPSVPGDFSANWGTGIRRPLWSDGVQLQQDLIQVYASALENSNAIKVFSDLPLIRETAMQEALGDYDTRAFGELQFRHTDEPTSSELTTGFTGRFIENLGQLDYGLRKRTVTGGEVTLGHRMATLESNSTFLDPNPQTSSEVVLSIIQPLGRGSGFAYNRARLKVAKLDADLAAAEYLRSLESHLLEVNRAYWEVFLARAAYLQKEALVAETGGLVSNLKERQNVDTGTTGSALLRAQSSLAQRRAALIRSEMSIRNAEERLRALVNDPNFAMGSGGEFIPLTRPVVGKPISDVKATARAALYHRPEVAQGFNQLRAAGIRRDIQRNEIKPKLDLVAEARMAGNDEGRQLGDPLNQQFRHGVGWMAGLSYESSLDKNIEIARMKRREYEVRQQANQLRNTIDQVLLEAVVTYRELLTAYRDMQGRWQAVTASREEVRELKERLDIDANDNNTVGDQLQLILDAIERNQASEEAFLVSLVAYNTAFASVERAKGTLLEYYDVDVQRFREDSIGRHKLALETLGASMGSADHDVDVNSGGAEWSRHRKALDDLKAKRGQ